MNAINPTTRPSPYHLGRHAARLGTLKGLPYGPGWRQQQFIQGFHEARVDAGVPEALSLVRSLDHYI